MALCIGGLFKVLQRIECADDAVFMKAVALPCSAEIPAGEIARFVQRSKPLLCGDRPQIEQRMTDYVMRTLAVERDAADPGVTPEQCAHDDARHLLLPARHEAGHTTSLVDGPVDYPVRGWAPKGA